MPPKAARTPNVVAILGADTYRAEAALEQVLQEFIGPDRSEAVQVLRGDETHWTRVVDAARAGSLFVARRAVVLRGAEATKGEGDDLVAFLADPPKDVVLVLMGKADKRKALWKKITDGATVVDAEPLKGRALRSYLVDEIRRRKLRIDEYGVDELVERVGQDLRRAISEIDKLEAFAGDSRAVSADDVARVLGRGMAKPLYKLADAMMARRPAELLMLVDELLEEGEPALRMLATLHRAVRQTRAARALVASRAPRDQMASRLGVPPFKIGEVMDAARRWSDADLRTATQALAKADLRIKTGSDAKLALAALVAEACAR